MNCIFIYNPISGNGHINKKIDYINEKLKSKYDEVTIYKTSSKEDMINVIKESYKYDHLIFAGGDGTFNDVVNTICLMDKFPVLGYIPCGTANDMANNLKISKKIKKALDVILNGEEKAYDVGKISNNSIDKYFIYVTGVGNLCSIAYNTKQKNKKVFGKVAYVFNGLKDFFKPKLIKAKIKIGDEILDGEFPLILVMNSISVGGFKIDKNKCLNNNKFDVVLVKKNKIWNFFNVIRLLLNGAKKKETKYYLKYSTDKISIDLDNNILWTIDGERGLDGSVTIVNLPSYIKIIQK